MQLQEFLIIVYVCCVLQVYDCWVQCLDADSEELRTSH
jgi:hypothetical protein